MGKPVSKVGKKKKKKKVLQGEKVEKDAGLSGKTGKPLEESKF